MVAPVLFQNEVMGHVFGVGKRRLLAQVTAMQWPWSFLEVLG